MIEERAYDVLAKDGCVITAKHNAPRGWLAEVVDSKQVLEVTCQNGNTAVVITEPGASKELAERFPHLIISVSRPATKKGEAPSPPPQSS